MSVVPILVPILLPERTNRFPRFWIQAVEQYEDSGSEEVSSTLGCLSQTLPGDTHNGVCR